MIAELRLLITLLGRPVYASLRRSDYVALHSVSDMVPQTVVSYYNRAVIRGELVHSITYCKDFKRNSCTVQLNDGSYFQVVTFLVTDLGDGENCYALGRRLHQVPLRFCSSSAAPSVRLSHITAVSKVPTPKRSYSSSCHQHCAQVYVCWTPLLQCIFCL